MPISFRVLAKLQILTTRRCLIMYKHILNSEAISISFLLAVLSEVKIQVIISLPKDLLITRIK